MCLHTPYLLNATDNQGDGVVNTQGLPIVGTVVGQVGGGFRGFPFAVAPVLRLFFWEKRIKMRKENDVSSKKQHQQYHLHIRTHTNTHTNTQIQPKWNLLAQTFTNHLTRPTLRQRRLVRRRMQRHIPHDPATNLQHGHIPQFQGMHHAVTNNLTPSGPRHA